MSRRRLILLCVIVLAAVVLARMAWRYQASLLGKEMTRAQVEALVRDAAPDFEGRLAAVRGVRGLSVRVEEPWRRWVVLDLASADDVDLLKKCVLAHAHAPRALRPGGERRVREVDWPGYLKTTMPAPSWWDAADLPDCDVLRIGLGGGQEDGWAFSRARRRAYLLALR